MTLITIKFYSTKDMYVTDTNTCIKRVFYICSGILEAKPNTRASLALLA